MIFLFGLEALLHKRFQGPIMCCLVPSLKSRLLLAIMMIDPVAIGSYTYNDQTSLLFPSLDCVGPRKTLFILPVFIHIILHNLLIYCLWVGLW